MRNDPIDISSLHAALSYDPEIGELKWKIPLPRTPAGTIATRRGPKGKLIIRFGGTIHYAHRVIWLLVYDEEPKGQVLPKDGDFTNLRLANWSDVPHADAARRQKTRRTNTSGITGVTWNAQTSKWIASITKEYRRYHLGNFDTKEEAAEVYRLAEADPSSRSAHATDLPRYLEYRRRQRWIGQRALQAMPALAGFPSWADVVKACGLPSSADHVLMRPNITLPLGPGNAEWRLPYTKGGMKVRYHHAHLGLSTAQFNQLVAARGNKCSICGQPEKPAEDGSVRSLVLDHDHVTGAVRGVLCNDCNRALGLFGDLYDRVCNAVEYMRFGQFSVAEELGLCARCQKTDDVGHMLALDGDGNVLGAVCADCEPLLPDFGASRPSLRAGDPVITCISSSEVNDDEDDDPDGGNVIPIRKDTA